MVSTPGNLTFMSTRPGTRIELVPGSIRLTMPHKGYRHVTAKSTCPSDRKPMFFTPVATSRSKGEFLT